MKRRRRWMRKMMVVCSAGVLPAFVLKCDKAALNFQRGFFGGLGASVAQFIVDNADQVAPQ